MPKYRYFGTGPCRYGARELRAGDVIDASAKPGKNFEEVVAAATEPVSKKRTTTTSDSTEPR